MTIMIELNEEDIEIIQTGSLEGHVLRPVRLVSGKYVLGLRVLNDSAHEAHWPFLQSKPQRDIAQNEFPLPPNRLRIGRP